MKKQYILDAFPFPSGAGLHIGHTVGYLATDIYSRYLKKKGDEVFHPMGTDSYGLPTELYALKVGKDPRTVTEENIANFKSQLSILNLDLNWEAEISTCDEKYYKWTQWIFTLLRESWFNPISQKAEHIDSCPYPDKEEYRLAYKKFSEVNWCDELGTVLANDEVENGKSVRGDYPVIKKEMNQWFLRITPYADRLLSGLENVEWKGKHHQINWIGKSEGFEIDFQIKNSAERITVFTTKPETLKDVDFIVTSRNSNFATEGREGEYFTGHYAIVPYYNYEVPIWVADYVVDGYGTGFVMGVPCDDKRDRDFGIKYGLYFPEYDQTAQLSPDINNTHVVTRDELVEKGYGRIKINYKLHDITFSRQRKWGEPIPIEGETDTMPSYAGSNWYFFRYLDSKNDEYFCDKEKQKKWLPVDTYVCGAEHTTGHILYARFVTKVLFDLGHSEVEEPFKKIINVGLMMGSDGKKMSKSGNNSVDPSDLISTWGVDAFRLWVSFIAPFEQTKTWKEDGLKGCAKFLRNFEKMFDSLGDEHNDQQTKLATDLVKRVGDDIEKFSFNTAIPRFMTFVNEMSKFEKKNFLVVLRVLDSLEPFAPDFVKKMLQKYSMEMTEKICDIEMENVVAVSNGHNPHDTDQYQEGRIIVKFLRRMMGVK